MERSVFPCKESTLLLCADKFIDIEAPKKKVPFSSLGELKPEVRVLSIPLAKNFPSVVSLMDPDVLFRITLADWHDINGDGLIDAALVSF